MLAEWQDALDGDFSIGGIAAGWTDPELQRALQGSNYSDPERLNTLAHLALIRLQTSAGTADEPGSHEVDVAISDSISGDEQH